MLHYISIFLAPILLGLQSFEDVSPARQWSQYRGYYSNGFLNNADLPDEWDIKSGKNVKWKIKVPGLGLSSPVIWDNKLFRS